MSKEMSQIEANTRKLIAKSKPVLQYVKGELENDYSPDQLFEIGMYTDVIESLRLIDELEKELNDLSEKRVSPLLKQTKIPY